eukprot:63512-Prorocentrum_minimum.AAC.1
MDWPDLEARVPESPPESPPERAPGRGGRCSSVMERRLARPRSLPSRFGAGDRSWAWVGVEERGREGISWRVNWLPICGIDIKHVARRRTHRNWSVGEEYSY